MNQLLNLDYFQLQINRFIFHDNELLKWKYVCRSNYYYKHNIAIKKLKYYVKYHSLKYTNIIEIDTSKYVEKYQLFWTKWCPCKLNSLAISYFDFTKFNYNLKHVKKVILANMYFNNFNIFNAFYFIEYLDLGMNTHIPDNIFKKVPNLKSLYLRNNYNTKEIFQYLPNLQFLQICYIVDDDIYYINLDDIPEKINTIMVESYSNICPIEGRNDRDGCEPISSYLVDYKIVKK